MFPDEETAVKWFEKQRWSDGRHCPHCGGTRTKPRKGGKPMPYHCPDCRKYFSCRTGTVMELDTIDQIVFLAKGMVGKRLPYKKLTS